MELTNDFRVALPVERAWAVLTDVELIAPCLPGAQLQEIEGDEYRGIVKVKVGPITAQYKGKATFLSLDEDDARGRAPRRGPRDPRPGQRQRHHHGHPHARRRGHGGRHRHRPHHHRPGGPVRPRRAGRRERQAARPVRGRPREDRARRLRPRPRPWRLEPEPEPDRGRRDARPPEPTPPAVRRRRRRSARSTRPEPEPVDLLDTAGTPVARRVAPVLVDHRGGSGCSRSCSPATRTSGARRRRGRPSRRRGPARPARPRRLRGRRPPRRRLARWSCATRRSCATARRCPPATGSSASPSAPGCRASRPPAASTGPRPRSTPTTLAAAHARYAAERDAAIPPTTPATAPAAASAAPASGVKCLHAHYAWHLAGGDDPVGRWIDAAPRRRPLTPRPAPTTEPAGEVPQEQGLSPAGSAPRHPRRRR